MEQVQLPLFSHFSEKLLLHIHKSLQKYLRDHGDSLPVSDTVLIRNFLNSYEQYFNVKKYYETDKIS